MSMLTGIGAHCSLCGRLDFLPFTCEACNKQFCAEHKIHPTCSVLPNKVVAECPLCNSVVPVLEGEDPNKKVNEHIEQGCHRDAPKPSSYHACCVRGCTQTELVPVTCPQCNLNFCFRHRHGWDHNCSGKSSGSTTTRPTHTAVTPKPTPTLSTPTAASSTTASASVIPKQPESVRRLQTLQSENQKRSNNSVAKKVALMKLKQHARGDQNVPSERRFYVEVVFPFSSNLPTAYCFFDQSWPLGKVLDKIAEYGNIPNHNDQLDSPKLMLICLKTGIPLHLPSSLAETQAEGILASGDAVLLETSDALL
ncbi:zinc finger protein, AN1 type domain 2B [Pelomyxa schiedti]|nr:zinc finger protein, AN1 type domain 2B [Pelomyxa schiedti]